MTVTRLRVLALVHRHLIPPDTIEDGTDIVSAPWRTEYDVISTLRAMGHEVQALGVHDVVSKSQGSSNPYNMIRATFAALANEDSPRSVAARRSLKVSTIQSRRTGVEADASDS